MNNKQHITQQIEAYLNNQLSHTEHAAFEKALSENSALKKEVELHKTIHAAINKKGKTELKTELNQYYRAYKHQKKRSKYIKIFAPLAAAAATILLIITLYQPNKQPASSENTITLDSAQVHTPYHYADSASFSADTIK